MEAQGDHGLRLLIEFLLWAEPSNSADTQCERLHGASTGSAPGEETVLQL